jgi:hypothetical protein
MALWDTFSKSSKDAFSGTEMPIRCYESHPALKLGKGTLVGGSASYPAIKKADVYVSLQSGSTSGKSSDPWEPNGVVEIHYSIQDMNAPVNTSRFKKMVTWLCTQLQDGKTVHVGCVGGHGRTGIVISAIVAELTGKKDAIQWVRKHYCKKAVESKAQVQFLMKHYGVTEVTGTKSGGNGNGKWHSLGPASSSTQYQQLPESKVKQIPPEGVTAKTKQFSPMPSARSLWKAKKR